MIEISKVDVFGWESAIRGMRNPMNSWDKSDSHECLCEWGLDCAMVENDHEPAIECNDGKFGYCVGKNDLKLMTNLSEAGSDHGKLLRFLIVQLDIEAPFYWWKEFKTYRKGRKFMDDGDEFLDPEEFEMFIETNSCSTMHKIHAKEFTLDDFSHEHLIPDAVELLKEIVATLNDCRDAYINYDVYKDQKDFMSGIEKKDIWWQMIQLLPSSYNQKRTVQLNYQVLKSMYHARKHHKLNEWREFCEWCETLPYFKEICIDDIK